VSPQIWAPRPGMTRGPVPDPVEEADTLVRILREQGPLHVSALRDRAQARYWARGASAQR
jgi:hypothetical protein